MSDKLRTKEIAKIHCGRRELGLDEAMYRGLLEQVAGVTSAKDLDAGARTKVIEYMRSKGAFPGDRHTAPAREKPELRKIRAMLRADEKPVSYGDAIAKRMWRRDRLEWCSREELRAVIAALTIDRRRHATTEPTEDRGVAGDRCESGNACGRVGCPECQQ